MGHLLALDRAGVLLQALLDGGHGHLDALLDLARRGAGGDLAHTLVHEGLGQHGGGGGAVARDVVGLGGDFLGELRAHVLVRVVELDLKEGDVVIYSKYGGTEVKYGADEYLVLSARDVLAIIEK